MLRPRILVLAAALGGVACTADDAGSQTPGAISTTLTDSSVAAAPPSASAGSITFQARNDGTTTHELYVFATDLPADQLPVEDGLVDESADGVEFISEVEDIAPGTSKDLTVELDAGNYVLLCNIAGHYEAGMRTSFDVT
jgi:uncharacterized cupredoxin-like copper-binding protein